MAVDQGGARSVIERWTLHSAARRAVRFRTRDAGGRVTSDVGEGPRTARADERAIPAKDLLDPFRDGIESGLLRPTADAGAFEGPADIAVSGTRPSDRAFSRATVVTRPPGGLVRVVAAGGGSRILSVRTPALTVTQPGVPVGRFPAQTMRVLIDEEYPAAPEALAVFSVPEPAAGP